MNYEEIKSKIEECGTHALLGPYGWDWGIEQNPHELAVFLSSIPEIKTVLEVGTGYKAGLSRFFARVMGYEVTTIDVRSYPTQVRVPEVTYLVNERPFLDARFDLIFLDASKTKEDALADWNFFGDYGRIVAMHDIDGLRGCEGVAEAWELLSRTTTGRMRKWFHEVIEESVYSAGIGWYAK